MTITITVDSKAVEKRLKGASKALRKHVAKKLRKVSGPGINKKFKQFSPKGSSRLSNSGKVQVFPKHMRLQFSAGEGIVGFNTGFPYPLWAAGIIPTITARPPFFPSAVSGKKIRYGDTVPGLKWSATRGWWRGVQKFANRKVPQDVNVAVREFVKEMNQ